MKKYLIFFVIIIGIVFCAYGMDDQAKIGNEQESDKAKAKVTMIVDVVNHVTEEGLSEDFLNDLVIKITTEELRDTTAIEQYIRNYKQSQLKAKKEREHQEKLLAAKHAGPMAYGIDFWWQNTDRLYRY